MAIPVSKMIKWACEDVYYTPIVNELTSEMLKNLKVTLGENEEYRVIDATGKSYASGLIALVVEDPIDGDKAIIYQGSIGEIIGNPFKRTTRDWMGNNIPNALGMSVAQYNAAEDFYRKMKKKHGFIRQVSGNSLGGGSAAYVATKHPEVFALSVNGAPMPKGYLKKKKQKTFNNILNIRCDGDVLSRLCLLLYRGEDYPGSVYMVNRGMFSLDYGCIELCHRGTNMTHNVTKEGPSLGSYMVFDPLTHMPIRMGNGLPLYKRTFSKLTKENGEYVGDVLINKSQSIEKDMIAALREKIKRAGYKNHPFYTHVDVVETKVEILLSGIVSKLPQSIQESAFFRKWVEEANVLLNKDLRHLVVHNDFNQKEMVTSLKGVEAYLTHSLKSIFSQMRNIGRLLKGKSLLKESKVRQLTGEEEAAISYLLDYQIISFQKKIGEKNFPKVLKDLDKELLTFNGSDYFKKNKEVKEDLLRTVKAFRQDVVRYLLTGASANDLYYYLYGVPYDLEMVKGLLRNTLGHVKASEDMADREAIMERIPALLNDMDNLAEVIKRLL